MNALDKINLCHIWLKTYFHEHSRWRHVSHAENPAVFYGFDDLPKSDEYVFGGMVKLFDLQSAFSNTPTRPNFLYLVSSALPYFPVRMAKMAKEGGAKVIINQNGVAYPGWYGKGWQKQNQPMRELLRLADYVIYQSEFCRETADRFLGIRVGASEVLYNPVNTNVFCPLQVEENDTETITLLLAGSHWSLYRPQVAIEVLRLVSRENEHVKLKIAGRFCWEKNPEVARKQVSVIAERLGVGGKVEYVGPYTQHEAASLIQGCSILLHTKYNDPCPRLVVEAMACGLPVVYSATGGVPELVGSEAGIGVPGPVDWEKDHPPDPEELAKAVLGVISIRKQLGSAARKRALEKFDIAPWLTQHGRIFHMLSPANQQVLEG